jgi:hypothetical protein
VTQETKYQEMLDKAIDLYRAAKAAKGLKNAQGIYSDQVKAVLWVVAGELVKHGQEKEA